MLEVEGQVFVFRWSVSLPALGTVALCLKQQFGVGLLLSRI